MARLLPDTSVLVDGRLSEMVAKGDHVFIARESLAELESQANRGRETGISGLDELANLHALAKEKKFTLEFVGDEPTELQIHEAKSGAIDRRIRRLAAAHDAKLVTSDRVQSHAAKAEGIAHEYMPPIVAHEAELELPLQEYFDDETMSVHLRADTIPMAKRGVPGDIQYEEIREEIIEHHEVRALIHNIIEYAKRDYHSYIELERKGCTVLQVRNMRIAIAQPPFSDALEITAVRPVTSKELDDYDLSPTLLERIEDSHRGIFVSGPPGSGKSTFAAAVAGHLHRLGRVVKTMEQPRDLQVPHEVSQYGALDSDMQWTGEVLLLVRPDNVIYDEVRTTKDFNTYADMRLAGVGLIGVTHANQAIDAIQRLIGRIDLGMIPQIVDTVIHIDKGGIGQILDLEFTVRVPHGMQDDSLARPVIVVRDFQNNRDLYELYSFGEQVVVMPMDAAIQQGRQRINNRRGRDDPSMTQRIITRQLSRYVESNMRVTIQGRQARVEVEDWEVGQLLREAGKTIRDLERRYGVVILVKSQSEKGAVRPVGSGRVSITQVGANTFVNVGAARQGEAFEVYLEDQFVGMGTVSKDGRIRFKSKSHEGEMLLQGKVANMDVKLKQLE